MNYNSHILLLFQIKMIKAISYKSIPYIVVIAYSCIIEFLQYVRVKKTP